MVEGDTMMGFRFTEMDENTWITADGQHVSVRNMDFRHLVNTVNLLRRREPLLRLIYLRRMGLYIMDAPDGASMACEAEAIAICKMTPNEFLEILVPPFGNMLRSLTAKMS